MHRSVIALITLAVLAGCQSAPEGPVDAQLRILETSDIHANVMDFDYYKGQDNLTIGLARTAAVVATARAEVTNSVLIDNGDLIQGSPMGDYFAATHKDADFQVHPSHKAMNLMDYTIGNIGNHEFNYGLPFLEQAIKGADFPYISANVVCLQDCGFGKKNGESLFTPFEIIDTEITDSNGQPHLIKIGYIGFVPPQILQWDKQNLTASNGQPRLKALGIVEAAEQYIPQMKAQGADLIIAIPHSGIGSSEAPADVTAENATYALTRVEGIDAVLFGHSHSVFPSARFASQADSHQLDLDKGTINGVPAVMPGRWGDNLGQIDLSLRLENGQWQVIDSQASVRAIYQKNEQGQTVATADVTANSASSDVIRNAVAEDHTNTVAFVNQPIGQSNADMYSFLTLVQDDPTIQIVSDAQLHYVQDKLNPELKSLPLLAASAPFKAGGRHSTLADADSYTQVAAGTLSFKNAADLYLYPNTVVALQLSGAEVKDWLECSANQFNQIDVNSTAPQGLINWAHHRTYNFDVIDGVNYQVDVSQPSRFDAECNLVDNSAHRIINLSYTQADGSVLKGEEFAQQQFVVITNNYRAFGGSFAGTGPAHVVQEFPDMNRDAVSQYISAMSANGGVVDPRADNNWSLAPISQGTKLDVRFETQDSPKAAQFIKQYQQLPMNKVDTDALGFAVYSIEL